MPRGVPIEVASQRLSAWIMGGGLEAVLRRLAGDVENRLTGRAIEAYMRDAKGEPLRRRHEDRGPLRIVTGALAKSLRTGDRNAVERIRTEGMRVVMEKGTKLPYPHVHEYGNARTPARPFYRPSVTDLGPDLRSMAEKRLARAFARAMRDGGAGSQTGGGE